MKKNRRGRGLLVALAGMSVLAGFMACSGSSTKRTGRNDYQGAGGEPTQTAGASGGPGAEQGGSSSTVTAGQGGAASEGGRAAGAGETSGGAPGNGGAAGEATGATGGGAPEGGAAGESSNGGESSVGGESSSGGQAQGGQAQGGAGGEGGQAPFVDPVCGANLVQVGEYSLWCGKVNMHTDAQGQWLHDADCTSGCDINGVSYCQKFYPSATAVVGVPQLGGKNWMDAGCDPSTQNAPGISGQAACCAPAP